MDPREQQIKWLPHGSKLLFMLAHNSVKRLQMLSGLGKNRQFPNPDMMLYCIAFAISGSLAFCGITATLSRLDYVGSFNQNSNNCQSSSSMGLSSSINLIWWILPADLLVDSVASSV